MNKPDSALNNPQWLIFCKSQTNQPNRYYPSWSVDLGVIAMKGDSTFPIASELEPHHQMQFNVIPRTHTYK